MPVRTEALLRTTPAIWSDGYLAFGAGRNVLGSTNIEAALAFFGPRFIAPTLSGHGTHELLVTPDALREIDQDAGYRALVQLLRNEVRMFSTATVDSAVLENLARMFFQEMGPSLIYSNTVVYPASGNGECLGPWYGVTRHTADTLICAINETCVAYWLYGDDE